MAPVYPIDLDIDFTALMALESHGPDVYVGISPDYPWGRVYGGQVVAQGLRAAAATVDEDRHVHSLHAYFIRGGAVSRSATRWTGSATAVRSRRAGSWPASQREQS